MSLSKHRQSSRRARQRQLGLRSGLRLESLENRVVFSGASPVAVNDLYEAMADETMDVSTASVLANDTDAEGDALTAREFLGPKHGTLNLHEDGTFEYTPNPGFSGVDGFVYQADDGTSESALAAVTIQVVDPNSAPTGVNDAYAVDEDGILEVIATNGVLTNDVDEDGDALTAELVGAPEHGTLELQADGGFTYTPEPDYAGADAFTYQASDGEASSELVVVEITVSPVNDAPVAQGESFEVAEDGLLEIPAAGVLENDADVEGDPLTAVLEQGPQNGTLELSADGGFTYTPEENFSGLDTFSYHVSDGNSSSQEVTAEIMVLPVGDAPVVSNDFFSTSEDEPLIAAAPGVLSNDLDPDGDTLVAELIGAPDHGTLEFNADGSFEYTPDADFHGSDAFTYRISDGSSFSDLGVAEILVTPVNDAPLAGADEYTTQMDVPLVIPASGVLENDTDIDGDQLIASLVSPPESGTVELAEDGGFVYTPAIGFTGQDEFSYQASDGMEAATAMVVITVQGVNQTPLAQNDSYTTMVNLNLSVAADEGVLANDSDPNSDVLSVDLFRSTSHGTLQLNSDGSFEYTPDEGYVGIDSFIYRANDGEMQSALAVVTLHILPPDIGDGENEVVVPEPVIDPIDTEGEGQVGLLTENEPCSSELIVDLNAGVVDNVLGSMDLRGAFEIEFEWLRG